MKSCVLNLHINTVFVGNYTKLTDKKLPCCRCSKNTVARMVAFQRPIKSGSKAGSQFSLSCLVSLTGVNLTSEPGV